MYIDLSEFAGFELAFDPETQELRFPEGMEFKKSSRRAADMNRVLYDPRAIDPSATVYDLYYPHSLPADIQAKLDRYKLTYSFVLMPPLRVGDEYAKTSGHYHPPIPGTNLPFPEVYTQLYGTLHLLLQKRDPSDLDRIQDCRLVEMTPGFTITLPPGYAHILINTTGEPGLMAGLYGREFAPNYAPVQARRGLAYYLLADGDALEAALNPAYPQAPPLKTLSALEGTPFEYADPGIPLWSSFISRPERYAFLTMPEEATRMFGEST